MRVDEGRVDHGGEGWTATARHHDADGTLAWGADRHEDHGTVLWGDDLGAVRVDPDGTHVTVAGPRWRALLLAQGLPLAATLQGLEPLHAGAVATPAGVVAFTGVAHAGKSTLTAAAIARGARFVADDVLALEDDGSAVVGHPGTVVLQPRDAAGAKQRSRPPRTTAPLPVAAVVLLDRTATELAVGPLAPEVLLASSSTYLDLRPARALAQLDLLARLAGQARVLRVGVPPGSAPETVVDAVADHVGLRWS